MTHISLLDYMQLDASYWTTLITENVSQRSTEGWENYILFVANSEGYVVDDELSADWEATLRYFRQPNA